MFLPPNEPDQPPGLACTSDEVELRRSLVGYKANASRVREERRKESCRLLLEVITQDRAFTPLSAPLKPCIQRLNVGRYFVSLQGCELVDVKPCEPPSEASSVWSETASPKSSRMTLSKFRHQAWISGGHSSGEYLRPANKGNCNATSNYYDIALLLTPLISYPPRQRCSPACHRTAHAPPGCMGG